MDGLDWNNDRLCEANLGRHQILCSKLHKQQRLPRGVGADLDSSLKTGADKLGKMILQSPERNRQGPDWPDNHSEDQLSHFADVLKTGFSIGLS